MRFIIPNLPHHAIQRGNNRQHVFFDREDRLYFLNNLKKISKEENILIGAYCLMANHFHLLLYPDSRKGLIAFMKQLNQLYAQKLNRKYKRTGKLWENRYKLHLVDPDYEWVVSRYIDRNPLQAKVVNDPLKYVYSSAKAHLLGIKDELLTKDVVDSRYSEYRAFFGEPDASSSVHIASVREIIQQNKILGKPSFIEELERKFKACFHVRKRGRPPKKERENENK